MQKELHLENKTSSGIEIVKFLSAAGNGSVLVGTLRFANDLIEYLIEVKLARLPPLESNVVARYLSSKKSLLPDPEVSADNH